MSASTVTAPVAEKTAEIYSEADRIRDRALCQRYFRAWTGSFGMTSEQRAAAPAAPISFAEFEAAAARLAQPRT